MRASYLFTTKLSAHITALSLAFPLLPILNPTNPIPRPNPPTSTRNVSTTIPPPASSSPSQLIKPSHIHHNLPPNKQNLDTAPPLPTQLAPVPQNPQPQPPGCEPRRTTYSTGCRRCLIVCESAVLDFSMAGRKLGLGGWGALIEEAV